MSADDVWVIHRGGLGDSVLLWPMLRSLAASGSRATLVTDASRGALASRFLGVAWRDIESPWVTHLWRDAPPEHRFPRVRRVVLWADDPPSRFKQNLARTFPDAQVTLLPGRPDRLWALGFQPAHGPARSEPAGPIVLHAGAGSESKRWPLRRVADLCRALAPRPALVLAGQTERERFSPDERRLLADLGGRFLDRLDDLADTLLTARAFVGCDTGPSHLAAQLGLPTVVCFGPTDPHRWAPIGPDVRVVVSPTGRMPDLDHRRVLRALDDPLS